jgi:hypothetical protein
MPTPGQEETVRVVALDRSFHLECYRLKVHAQGSGSTLVIGIGQKLSSRVVQIAQRLKVPYLHTKGSDSARVCGSGLKHSWVHQLV